jgi:heat shock protein HtpX
MYEQIARNKRRTVACILVFLVMWMGIGALIGWVWASVATPPVLGAPAPIGADTLAGLAVAGLLALAGVAFSLTSGSRVLLAASGARPADPDRYRQLHNLVAAMAVGEGLPTPAVYVIDDPSPNAFATGASPTRAAITVTTGLLAMMNREELEGVLAHEMSHIKNYDVRLLLVVGTLIGMAGLMAALVWRSGFFMGGRGRRGSQAMLIVVVAGALLGLLALIFGPLVRLALSRQRESLADVSAVELTRNPIGLIHALQKLQANDQPLARTNQATAAMCIDDPLQHHEGRFRRLFDSHPPLAQRIAVLERVALGESV